VKMVVRVEDGRNKDTDAAMQYLGKQTKKRGFWVGGGLISDTTVVSIIIWSTHIHIRQLGNGQEASRRATRGSESVGIPGEAMAIADEPVQGKGYE
jgi:hypothetical protein